MNEMKVEGNKTVSETVKDRGTPISHTSEHSSSDKSGVHGICGGNKTQIGFEAGRTIELKQYEFCRIRLGLRLRLPDSVNKETAKEAARQFVDEMLKREESAVQGGDYATQITDETKAVLSNCVCRCIKVLYGLTLKSGSNKFESHQVDIIEELPVSDGADLVAEFESLSSEMAEDLDKEHNRIKGKDKDTGL